MLREYQYFAVRFLRLLNEVPNVLLSKKMISIII